MVPCDVYTMRAASARIERTGSDPGGCDHSILWCEYGVGLLFLAVPVAEPVHMAGAEHTRRGGNDPLLV